MSDSRERSLKVSPVRRVGVFLLLIGAVLFLSPSPSEARPPYTFATAAGPPYVATDQGAGFLDKLLSDAFRRLSLDAKVYQLPGERALANANAGIEDGDAMRVKGMEKIYTNLLRVPVPIHTMEFVAFSRMGLPAIKNWADLDRLAVGVIRGWKIFEKRLANHPDVTFVRNADQLFLILKENRVDAVLFEKWQAAPILKKLDFVPRVHSPALAAMPMYIYLNKRNEDLVPRLADALSEMKSAGKIRSIYQKTLLPWSRYLQP